MYNCETDISGAREGFSTADAERDPQRIFCRPFRHPNPRSRVHSDRAQYSKTPPPNPTFRARGRGRLRLVPGLAGTRLVTDGKGICARARGWCQGGELNSRPRAYESPALPLSYPGKIAIAEEAKSKTVRSGFKSLCCSRDEFRLADGAGRDRCLSDLAFLWMAFSSRAFGDVGSPSGSRRIGNGAEHDPDKPVRRCHGADPVATRALPERPDNRPLTKMPTHF
jgi:hypothetical protein